MEAQSVIDTVSRTLIDEGTVRRWTEVELLEYLNEAIRAVITNKPSANVTNTSVLLTSGSKQTAPILSVEIQDITTNMGTDGDTPGRAVTLVNQDTLDISYNTWRTDSQTVSVKHWMYNPKQDSTVFYVYPPSDGTGYVEMSYSAIPTELTDVDDTIPLDDMYLNVMMEYMLFRCFEKDSDAPSAQARAMFHFQTAAQLLGVKLSMEIAGDPNITKEPDVKE